MPAKLVVVEEYRMFGNICGLQPSCHLAGMEGIAVPVSVTGDDHRGGIGHAIAEPGDRESTLRGRRNRPGRPRCRIHLSKRGHCQRGGIAACPASEPCKPRHGTDPAAALVQLLPADRSSNRRKSRAFLGAVRPVSMSHSAARKKIVVSRLTVAPLGGFVPCNSEFRSATNVRQRKQAAAFHKESDEDAELRRHGHTVAAVRGHDCRIAGSVENIAPTHKVHGNSCAVFRHEPNLGMAIVCTDQRVCCA